MAETPNLSIRLLQAIGSVEATDANQAFNFPFDVLMDPKENIYILDSGNQRIQVFNKDGKFLFGFGRFGQGPVEFSWPDSMDMDDQGRI